MNWTGPGIANHETLEVDDDAAGVGSIVIQYLTHKKRNIVSTVRLGDKRKAQTAQQTTKQLLPCAIKKLTQLTSPVTQKSFEANSGNIEVKNSTKNAMLYRAAKRGFKARGKGESRKTCKHRVPCTYLFKPVSSGLTVTSGVI